MEKTRTEKFRETMIRKHGSYEAYLEYQRSISSKGGKVRVPKGFATNRELAREAGRKGGSASRKQQ